MKVLPAGDVRPWGAGHRGGRLENARRVRTLTQAPHGAGKGTYGTRRRSTMPRTDVHLDAMLRHLGAAYYESLHGRATRVDVTRALDTVEEPVSYTHLRAHETRHDL